MAHMTKKKFSFIKAILISTPKWLVTKRSGNVVLAGGTGLYLGNRLHHMRARAASALLPDGYDVAERYRVVRSDGRGRY